MSFMDKLPELLNEKSAAGLDSLIHRASVIANETLEDDEAVLAGEALSRIAMETDALGHLGAAGLSSLLALSGTGATSSAKVRFTTATTEFERTRALSHESTSEAVADRLQREKDWERVAAMLQDLGKIALKVLPLLIAAA